MSLASQPSRAAKAVVRDASVRTIGRLGFHRIAYRDWGPQDDPRPVFCTHGLTRNAHDFDALAAVLGRTRRVICPDIVGRGRSDWLADGKDYVLPQYNLDASVLMAHVGADEVDWIGNSLGGLMGISLAGMPGSPIRRLVVNDIAPEVPFAALRRITDDMTYKPFTSLTAVERHLREKLAPFGPMTDADWRAMAQHSAERKPHGYVLRFDPRIHDNFRRIWLLVHFSLWRYWDEITCPVLILRGTESDFLTLRLLARMKERLPHADVIEFEGVGHTPTLNAPPQIGPVLEWLGRGEALGR